MIEKELFLERESAKIVVMGIGGAGGNAVEYMITEGVEGVSFIVANTDVQALRKSSATCVIQLGKQLTKGLGSGADPSVGEQAALESRDDIMRELEGADMVFLTAGMGGGTGTGAAPIIANIAKDMGILTVVIVTRPFRFEGKKRAEIADDGVAKLMDYCDSIILVPNDRLISVLGKSMSLVGAFRSANAVLQNAVVGITDLITRPGLINVDFADVRTVMSDSGLAMMGVGEAKGEDRAKQAALSALMSPLLEEVDLRGARGVLVNITAGTDMTIGEFETVGQMIRDITSEQAHAVVGTVIDQEMRDMIRVTVVATGLELASAKDIFQSPQASHLGQTIMRDMPGRLGSLGAPLSQPTYTAPATSATPVRNDFLDVPTFLRKRENTPASEE